MTGTDHDTTLSAEWGLVCKELEAEFGEAVFKSWLSPLEIEAVTNDGVTLSVPTRFMRDWIQSKYADRIRELFLSRLGHREKRPATDRAFSPVPYSKLVLIRRLADAYDEGLARLLAGEAADVLGTMALALVDMASARRDASTIQADLAAVQEFYELEARRLRMLRETNGIQEHFVPQAERDRLRIRAQDLAR